ncbi:MAG: TraR/DksA C4-type zinc finger protein [Actinobacteria bacterium]|nr:TraR/DksA C4-type zinc finger protein [Actinomycetota bacterium]
MDLETMERLKKNPRTEFARAVQNKDTTLCLIKTAEIHGHYCPGVALGVMASVWGLSRLGAEQGITAGMENLMAVVETNSCFTDGVQAVAGCTLGNNGLVYRDLGRTAVTFAKRGSDSGLRIHVVPEFRDQLDKLVPDFAPLMDKVVKRREGTEEDMAAFRQKGREASFAMMELPFESILAVAEVPVTLPGYAPMVDSVICTGCGEEIMETKTVAEDEKKLCLVCADREYYQVEGQGIVAVGL